MRAYLLWTFPASERRVSFSTNVQSPCLPLLQDSGNDDKEERTYFTLPMQPQGTTIMIMSDALCGSSISYSPLSFITSRTLTTAPPFRTSPEEMAAVWAGRRERGVCGRVVSRSAKWGGSHLGGSSWNRPQRPNPGHLRDCWGCLGRFLGRLGHRTTAIVSTRGVGKSLEFRPGAPGDFFQVDRNARE